MHHSIGTARLLRLAARLGAALLAAAACLPAAALELSWSGFGTLGYAQTNRPWAYQRQLRDEGGFERDSLLGAQVDAQFSPQWSATAQVTLVPSARHDSAWALTPNWAFLAWRPANDWLLRAGRLRLPLYLHSESLDVGQAHDMVRMPTEMYSLTPTTDFDGVAVTRTWAQGGSGEWGLDLYHGQARPTARFWNRDGLPPLAPAGANFQHMDVQATGLVLTLRETDLTLRAGLHRTRTRRADGAPLPVSYPFVALAPGLGYYQVDAALPGPGVPTVNSIRNTLLTLGAEVGLGGGWTVSGELARTIQHDTEFGSDSRGGYLAVSRRIGDVTPYASIAALRSSRAALDWYDRLTGAPLPAFIPNADLINAAQRMAAEGTYLSDQRSLALGGAWHVTPASTLKAEWMRTRIGRVSQQVNAAPGTATPRDTSVDVLSLNYSFVF